ncbi:5'-methylthioadenosine phosphorylase [Labilithrix luteola]|uniref:Purine nucleoside phosphorylase n=1 Tax=Labilithrix luteola TaxID=1391654 RepID=A0A0K1QFM2_9BACT|nr:MTAP family purine nucleoside phosphorylase [Labilithrix luteola]AKV04457.1 5'-methylthioadenosine phosphorylase [Labilithrix luteola]
MLGIIGGTGLGEALFGEAFGEEHVIDTPFGAPSSPVRVLSWGDTKVAVLARHGDGHTLQPSHVPYRANIFALKKLGVTQLLVSGAVGSLREEIRPRDLVVVDQLIDRTYRRIPTFFDESMAVHAEFAEPYCPWLRERVLAASSSAIDAKVHERGTYVCIEGPEFSTVAEARMHRALGADIVGMTALPEARLAREAEMCCALVAIATDYDCWRPHPRGTTKQTLLAEIIGHVKAATENAVSVLRRTISDLANRPPDVCACSSALELAIWTRRDRIDPRAIAHYGPLVDKYLGPK